MGTVKTAELFSFFQIFDSSALAVVYQIKQAIEKLIPEERCQLNALLNPVEENDWGPADETRRSTRWQTGSAHGGGKPRIRSGQEPAVSQSYSNPSCLLIARARGVSNLVVPRYRSGSAGNRICIKIVICPVALQIATARNQ